MTPSFDNETSEAARWALVLRDPDATFDEIQQFLAWLDANPKREASFDRVERFLEACDDVRYDIADKDPFPDAGISTQSGGLNRLHQGWALAATLVLAIVGLAMLILTVWPVEPQDFRARYASNVGESREIRLPDGSTVTLSGASAVSISFEQGERRIALTDGEALFSVSKDSHRPFVVETANGSTTAVGTAFNIHRDPRGATITVVHGIVDVAVGHVRTRLGPALQISYYSDGTKGLITRADLNAALGWRTGKLQFQHAQLAMVVADLNRYSPRPVTIEDGELGLIPVTGMVETDGILEWLYGFAKVANFEVVQSQHGILLKSLAAGDMAQR